jgi:predicted GIY-YIG superfamily endonuclease
MNRNFSTPNNHSLTPLGKALFAGVALYAMYQELTSEASGTVVYFLYNRNRIVYIGITYEDRVDQRIYEHECKDWVFDEYDYGYCMSRSQAIAEEKRLIKRHQPKYNVHHNLA